MELRTSKAIIDVTVERQRQLEKEGYSIQHDDDHDAGDLSGAGAAYALNASHELSPDHGHELVRAPDSFPWDYKYWKPKTPREDLVRAAALLIAEIERIDRKGWCDDN